ncbi:MAG: T9SS type A sorting domain-containing protein [Bacteroidota bacterium]
MNKFFYFLLFLSFYSFSYGQYVGLDWGYALDNQQYSAGTSIVTDPSGSSFIAGVYEGNLDMDPGPGTQIANAGSGNASVFIKKMGASGNFLWGHAFDFGIFSDSLSGKNMALDGSGNLYYTGIFNGTVDFDPGPNTFNLTANNISWGDFFVLKLDTNGDFIWAKSFGGPDYSQRANISIGTNGDAYLTGHFFGNLDFDPGPGSTIIDGGRNGKFFMQKLDVNGDFVWVRAIGNTNYNVLGSATLDSQDNLLLCGAFSGTLDLDPGAGIFNVSEVGNNRDIFVLKLDSSGNFVWGGNIKEGGGAWRTTLSTDIADNVYLSGDFRGTADFNPGAGTFSFTSSNNGNGNDGYIVKLNDQGIFQWAKQITETQTPNNFAYINPHIIQSDISGNSYIFGYFQGSVDFDPGPATYAIAAVNSSSYFSLKLSPAGDLIWVQDLNNGFYDLIRDVSIDAMNNIHAVGSFYQSFDVDPGPGTFTLTNGGSTSMYAFKWTQDSCSNLAAIIDSVMDVSCGSAGFASGYALGGTAPFTYTWNTNPVSTDTFASIDVAGTYEFSVSDANGCSRTSNFLVNGPTVQNGQDLVVNITSTPFRTGFPATIWIDAFNDGCTPVSGEVVLVLDPLLTYNSSSPAPDTIIGDSLIWYVSNMDYDSPHFMATVDVTVSLNAMIGDQICLDADISPKANDTNTKNNTRDYCRDVINAYDPNDKLASPQGLCAEGFIEADEVLTYTIRFQNTGNADAINIFILDTLDQDFDINSLKVVGQSHAPMITEILENRVLKFRFDNIHLPDSTTDEKNSHGYVMFEVAPSTGLAVGTELTNRVGIYFDFNEPVITNTVLNTITDVLPSLDTVFVNGSGCNSYTLNGRTYTNSGRYVQQLSGLGACDSIVILNLILQPIDTGVSQVGGTLSAHEGDAHGSNITYQWVDCENNMTPIAGATEKNFSPTRNGNYAVIISRDDCEEMSACYAFNSVGIDTEFQAQLKYYPNPSSGKVELDLGGLYQEIELSILNMLGQEMAKYSFRGRSILQLELPQAKGMYFIQLEADGKEAVVKLLKK